MCCSLCNLGLRSSFVETESNWVLAPRFFPEYFCSCDVVVKNPKMAESSIPKAVLDGCRSKFGSLAASEEPIDICHADGKVEKPKRSKRIKVDVLKAIKPVTVNCCPSGVDVSEFDTIRNGIHELHEDFMLWYQDLQDYSRVFPKSFEKLIKASVPMFKAFRSMGDISP